MKSPMAQFATRSAGNAGARIPLTDPVSGKTTDHWIDIFSTDSDVYIRANAKAMRNAAMRVEDEKDDEGARLDAMEENSLDILVALVKDWSFAYPESVAPAGVVPCTPENVRAFLKEAPQIRSAINRLSTDRSLFTKGNLEN
jgi:hypothetical protein